MRRDEERPLARPTATSAARPPSSSSLTLIALCGVIVLTVDVGQLLYKRRAMVNASDAAALSAAQACAASRTPTTRRRWPTRSRSTT